MNFVELLIDSSLNQILQQNESITEVGISFGDQYTGILSKLLPSMEKNFTIETLHIGDILSLVQMYVLTAPVNVHYRKHDTQAKQNLNESKSKLFNIVAQNSKLANV